MKNAKKRAPSISIRWQLMLFIGGIAAYTFVWDLGDVGIGLMTIFNIIALYPLAGEALSELKSYEESKKS